MTMIRGLARRIGALKPGTLDKGEARFLIDDGLVNAWNLMNRMAELRLPGEVKAMLARNRELAKTKRGRCWIIGNGPSIREQDLTLLRDEETFVVNRFIHHPQAELIDPKYYVIVDPKFGGGQWGTDFVAEVERRLPRVTLFTGPDGERFLEAQGLLRGHRRFQIYPNQRFTFGYPWEIELTRGIPGADNVTKSALCIAVWMGFTEINLLGIDGNGLLLSDNSHFYGHVAGPDNQIDLEKAMVSSALSMRGWRALPGYLERRGIRLVSRNPRSVLTAIPYEPYRVD